MENTNIAKVYMIVSPTFKIYVGSTIRPLYKRWNEYKNLSCKSQTKLYNSFLKYGVENHRFFKLWEGPVEEMYKMENYYGKLYNVLEENMGLNCFLPKIDSKFTCISEETRKKQRIAAKNKPPVSKETRQKISIAITKISTQLGLKISKALKGKKLSNETKNKIRLKAQNRKLSEETKKKIGIAAKKRKRKDGIIVSLETRLKMSNSKKGISQNRMHILNRVNCLQKKIIQTDLNDNFIREWESVKKAGEVLNINPTRISECLKNKRTQTKNFKFKYKQI